MKIHKKSVLYSTLQLTISSLVLQILGFIFRIGMSRLATAQGVGVYQLIMPVYSVMQSLTLSGITLAVSTLSAQSCALRDFSGVKKLVRTALLIFCMLFSVLCAVSFFSVDLISVLVCGSTSCSTALLLLLPCLFLTGFENVFKNCFYGIRKVSAPIFSEILEHVVRIAAVFVLLAVFSKSVHENAAFAAILIVCGMIIGEIFSSSALSFIYKKTVFQHQRPSKEKFFLKIVKIALPVTAAGVLNNIIASLTTMMIPQRLIHSGIDADSAMASFGVMFGMTFPLLMLPMAFLGPLMTVLIPRFSASNTLKDNAQLRRKTSKALHMTSLISAVCMAVLIPLAKPLCRILYGREDASNFFFPLAVSVILLFFQIVTSSILNAMDLQKKSCISVIISGITELAATYILVGIPSLRLYGYVIACIISAVVGCLINFVFLIKAVKFKVRWRNWFVTPYFSALISGLFCRFVYYFLLNNRISELLSVICAVFISFVSYLLFLRIQETDFIAYLKTVVSSEK